VLACPSRQEGTGSSGPWFTHVTVMQWNHERRLVFAATPTWLGWFCERCCWHITVGTEPTPQPANAQEQFDAHDCEEYALQNWKQSEAPVAGR
jgi:hypothetical protein